MAPRKKQSGDAGYDDLAISRVISKVSDSALQEFLLVVIDVITGISSKQQIRNVEQREALAKEVAAERQQIYEALRDVRHQYRQLNDARDADAADRGIVVDFLKRQDPLVAQIPMLAGKVEAVSVGQKQLRSEFHDGLQAIGERVSGIEADVSSLRSQQAAMATELAAHARKLGEHEAESDAAGKERRQIKEVVDGIALRMDTFIAQNDDEARRYRAFIEQLMREREGGN